MKNELITVIIPTYNAEKSIKRCIDSIIAQTYQNIEIIVINDGSTDETFNELQKFKKNAKVKIINQENSGPSKSRNIGLKHAKGKYIMFVDSDDYIEKNAIKDLYEIINLKKVKIVRFNYSVIDANNKNSNSKFDYEDKLISRNELFEQHLLKSILWNTVWGQLIESSIAKKTKFNENIKIGEDLLFNLDLYNQVDNVFYTNKRYYAYSYNNNGITKNVRESNLKRNLNETINMYCMLYKRYYEYKPLKKRALIKCVRASMNYQLQLIYVNRKAEIELINHLKNNNILKEIYTNYNERKYRLYVKLIAKKQKKLFYYAVMLSYIPIKTIKKIIRSSISYAYKFKK